ncbi:MAG: YbjN domain-containing protein [Pseudomonadota bacterium]
MRIVRLFLFFTAMACLSAKGDTISSTDPSSVVTALQDLGYRAKLETNDEGRPVIRSAAAGSSFSIYFYACNNDKNCKDIMFFTWFETETPLSLEAINSWNANKLTGKAYIDDDGDATIEFLLAGVQDVSELDFKQIMYRWDQALGEFIDFIDW